VLLVMSLDLLATTLKRLSMFVLRAKVKLTDASAHWSCIGLLGDSTRAELRASAPWQTQVTGAAHTLALYPAVLGQRRMPRQLVLAPAGDPALNALNGQTEPTLSLDIWQWHEVMSGVTLVTQPVFEAFVPQMLNYESVDGVNFKKGCYPGQEVVARSQFRGTLKRRAFIVQSVSAMAAGQEVFSSLDPTQPCGLIAQSASDGDRHVAVAELQLSATENSTLHLGTAEGSLLSLLPLPYALRDDI
jgi:folate-binding protein YgfZ